jgi:ribosome-associated protein
LDSRILAGRVAAAALEKKASDVLILDLRKLETVADYFVICTGDVDQHVRAIVDNIEKQIKTQTGERVFHREGTDTMNWVLLDYVDVVVHVFKPSFREFYRLEDLWGDADTVPVTDEQEALPRAKPIRRRVAVASVKPATVKVKAPAKKHPVKKAAAKKSAAKAPVAKPARKPAVKKAVKKSAAKVSPKKAAPPKRTRRSD